jgi:hypothetical protein
MAKIPVFDAIRIIPRDTDFLDRKSGSRGEIFIDGDIGTLRLYNGQVGGITLLKDDLSNISAAALNKNVNFGTGTVTATQFIGAGIGAVLGDTPPIAPVAQTGTLWFNTSTGKLYIYYNDGTSLQWVQPMTPSVGGGGGGGGALNDLTDVAITSATAGQVLKYNGTTWINDVDATGGGGSNTFSSIAVAGQSTVVADTLTDTLTLVAGTGITITTDAGSDTITITNSGTNQNVFNTVAVTGQGDVVADSTTDTLTLAAGAGIQITTDTGTDTVTITSTVSAGATTFAALTDNASLTVDQFYLPAITRLNVTNNGASAYRFDQYGTTDDPTIYAISATTIAFNLNVSGHPFLIQDNTGTNYNTGLVHVSTGGTVNTGSSAQGQTSGTLYWKIPDSISGNYRYQCSAHAAMIGTITIKNFATI